MDKISKSISEALKKPAKISMKREKGGKGVTNISGTPMAILVTLAGLEYTILNNLNVPKILWEQVKEQISTEEVKDNG